MRPPSDSSLRRDLWQAVCFAGGLLHCRARRHARHVMGFIRRLQQVFSPAQLPLYALAGIVGFAVALLVMSAWLRVVVPAVTSGHRAF